MAFFLHRLMTFVIPPPNIKTSPPIVKYTQYTIVYHIILRGVGRLNTRGRRLGDIRGYIGSYAAGYGSMGGITEDYDNRTLLIAPG